MWLRGNLKFCKKYDILRKIYEYLKLDCIYVYFLRIVICYVLLMLDLFR